MREPANATRIESLMRGIGSASRGPGRVYIVGGASAVLLGWREMTIDADLKLEPEPAGVFEAIAQLKQTLDINVELAAPDDFIPALPGWQERSRFIVRHGEVEFFHYDFYAQALAKIERGHRQDLRDVEAMAERDLIKAGELLRLFESIVPSLIRFPSIEPGAFRDKLARMLEVLERG